jgi:nucleotidyltransferase substrate binding protein (TIGR01987 family)
MIDFSPFEKALNTLRVALERLDSIPGDPFIRDACIQRFEYSFELSHKMLRRYLEDTEASADDVKSLSYPDLFRLGKMRGLINDEVADWNFFRKTRNATSHTYDEEKAAEVIEALPQFLVSSQALLMQLKQRQDTR